MQQIRKYGGISCLSSDIIKALISKQETTKKTNMNGGELSEESSSSCCSKRHGLSRGWRIEAVDVNRSEGKQLSEMMPFIATPHEIWVWGKHGEVLDAELTESLMRSIQPTHQLQFLTLSCINIRSSLAVEFVKNLFKQAPNWELLDMSWNPLLGAGVNSLIQHLSCAPHLKRLELLEVKITPQQADGSVRSDTAAWQHHYTAVILPRKFSNFISICFCILCLQFIFTHLFLLRVRCF